jgi:hypothetical protein
MTSSAEKSFRDSLRAFSSTTSTRNTYQPLSSTENIFPSVSSPSSWSFWTTASGNQNTTSTPSSFFGSSTTTHNTDDFCGLSLWQRYTGFFILAGLSAFCFLLAFAMLPTIALFPSKFVTAYTFGSLLALLSLAFIKGFKAHLGHLFSKDRLVYTGAYLSSMFFTLYFTLIKKNTILLLLCSLLQMIALVWYVGSYMPGGTSGLSVSFLIYFFCFKNEF